MMPESSAKPKDVSIPLTLRNGEHRGDLVLPLFPAGILSGRVVDSDGDPLPDRTVSLWKKHRPRRTVEPDRPLDVVSSNHAGEYRFESLEPGTYFVSAHKDSLPFPHEVSVDRDGKPTKARELKPFFLEVRH